MIIIISVGRGSGIVRVVRGLSGIACGTERGVLRFFWWTIDGRDGRMQLLLIRVVIVSFGGDR